MCSRSTKTKRRRAIRLKNIGAGRRRLARSKGTTPAFPIHK